MSPALYTCPMHPEIERDRQGECPICGMTLERKTIGADAEDQAEIRSLSRRFWIALALTLPVLFIAMGHEIPGVHVDLVVPKQFGKWIEFVLTTPVVLWAGHFIFNPMIAGAAMSFSDLSVVGNALRLRKVKL